MKNTNTFTRQFLMNRDETGRFIVKSYKTGKIYYVEPIYKGKTAQWGDIDPATKKVQGNYGKKYTGGITEKESLITQENGFEDITYIQGGSPFSEIQRRDEILFNSMHS